MTLEELGYKRVKETNYFAQFIRMRYEKDTTIYKIDNNIVPKDALQYRCKTILIFKEGVGCMEGISSNSFEEARGNSVINPFDISYCVQTSKCLSWDEIKALLEMREIGIFNKLY